MIFATHADTGKPRLSHVRCKKHEDVPLLNQSEESGAECALCVADAIADNLDDRHQTVVTIYRGMFERALTRLNLLSPGAGDSFRAEVMSELQQIKTAQQEQDDAERTAPAGDEAGGKVM